MGLIENMSHFICPHCEERTAIFGTGGGRREADLRDVPFLGEIPLHVDFREAGDRGRPLSAVAPDTPNGQAIERIARRLFPKHDLTGGLERVAEFRPGTSVDDPFDSIVRQFESPRPDLRPSIVPAAGCSPG